MADKDTTTAPAATTPAPDPAPADTRKRAADNDSEAQRVSRALAEAAEEAEVRKADETIPGGRYLVDGDYVDANGKRIK